MENPFLRSYRGWVAPARISSRSSPRSTLPGAHSPPEGTPGALKWKCHPQLWSPGVGWGQGKEHPRSSWDGRGAGKAGFGRSPAQLGLCLARGRLRILSINIPRQTPDGSRTFPPAGKTVGKTKDPDWNGLSRDSNPSSGIWGCSSRVPAPAEGTAGNREGLGHFPLSSALTSCGMRAVSCSSLELEGVSMTCRTWRKRLEK